jgi:hypothetical protein
MRKIIGLFKEYSEETGRWKDKDASEMFVVNDVFIDVNGNAYIIENIQGSKVTYVPVPKEETVNQNG